jgi:photosystem II stability/assembly factor-like uncharacterized protein
VESHVQQTFRRFLSLSSAFGGFGSFGMTPLIRYRTFFSETHYGKYLFTISYPRQEALLYNMFMLRLYICVSVLFLSFFLFIPNAGAQQAERREDEVLSIPVTSPNEAGVYKGINDLPADVRRTTAFARMLDELRHYAGSNGIYDRQTRLDAFEQTKSDIIRDAQISDKVSGSKLPVFANAWTNIGPINKGGMTKALAIDPTNANIVYAGAGAGGVWKSVNAGGSWTPLTDLVIPDLAVASIAIDPSNTNIIYVGSGDPSFATDGMPGSGLYKSTDAGATWAKIAATKFSGTVCKVLVHPNNSNIVFASNYDGNKGLYRSADGGATFTRVLPAAAAATGIIWDVAAAEIIAGKLIMYAVEGNNIGGSSTECGIYKSLDDGATWIKITSPGFPAGNTIGKAALAIPANDKTKVYCLMANPSGDIDHTTKLPGLWKSTNSGFTFTQVATIPSSIFNPGNSGPQGWYDLYLAAAPSAINDTLYIGGVEAYRSYNSGATWTAYSSYQIGSGPHVDHQSIAIDPKNSRNVFIGTDGGVYRSTDAGLNWTERATGFATMRFYHIGLDTKDQLRTYGGAQDQGIWKVTAGQAPSYIFPGDGFQPIVDYTNSNTLYVEGPFGDVYKSTNGGFNYFSIDDPAFDQNSGNYDPSEWETPFIMAPKNNLTLFEGRQHLWQTRDGGTSWGTVSNNFTYSGQDYNITSIGLSPANSSVWWVGLENGKIQITTNSGGAWTDKSTGIPSAVVRSIVCHPTDQNWALAAFEVRGTGSARVMRTTNGGTNWTNVSGPAGKNLPGVPVNCVALDSLNPSTTWYAATDNGIYYTRDAGATWSIAGSGLGLAPCWDVQVHANKTTIRVGTHGRSIWEGNVNVLPVELTGLSAKKTLTGTNLDWKTLSEHDDSGFWVERSYNYGTFEQIAFIPGAGNSNTEKDYSYFDPKHDDGYYIYRLNQIDLDGSSHLSNIVEVRYGELASALRLDQNFPNPFFAGDGAPGSTRIRYELPADDIVTIKITSVSGNTIRTIFDHVQQSAGEQNAFWDGTDNNGTAVAAGTYFYTLETASGGKLWNKLILMGR